MTTKVIAKTKTTSLQIPLNQSDKDIAELVTQELLGLSLGSTIKMIIKIIAQKKQIPLIINLSEPVDETTWLLNNPGYGQRLLDAVQDINQIINKNNLDKTSLTKEIKKSKKFVTFDDVSDFQKQITND
jgi:antitoxin component of RelBE/YafQ-DinJ toxin-antitoxin module